MLVSQSVANDTRHGSQSQVCEAVSEYVSTVCQQMRWKKARERVSDELTSHIADSRDAYLSQGLNEADATASAITDTGDAAIVGTQLDRVHRPKPQWGMLGTSAVLIILGLLVYAYFTGGLTANRLLFTGVGVAGLVGAYFIDFTWLAKYPKTLLFAVSATSLVVPFMRLTRRGAPFDASVFNHAGSGIQFYSIEDAIVLIFPLVLAVIVFYAKGKGYWGLIITGLSFALLVMVAFGIAVSGAGRFTITGFLLLGIAVAKGMFNTKKLSAALVACGPVTVLYLIALVLNMTNEFARRALSERIIIFFDPSFAPYTRGYWPMVTRGVLREAAWFGRGNSEWWLNLLYYPPVGVSYRSALSALIGLTGWVSFVVIVIALLFFIIKGAKRCFRQKSNLGLLVSSAVMLTFAVQAIEYVIYNMGFQVVRPVALPLVVSDNVAFIVNAVLIGFMLSVFRTGDAVVDRVATHDVKAGRIISWDDGKLIINFKPLSDQGT